MANTNGRNPTAEPTHQSDGASDKHPTADSHLLQFSQYVRGRRNNPPGSLVDRNIQRPDLPANCKDLPEVSLVQPLPPKLSNLLQ
jgi:hypothetical protein